MGIGQSGAAAAGLKINSGEVNGKANTSGWQLEGSGSAQHDNHLQTLIFALVTFTPSSHSNPPATRYPTPILILWHTD